MSKLKRINVVFVYVSDIEKARRFYEETIGFGQPLMKGPDWIEYQLEGGSHFAIHRTGPEHMKECNPSHNTIKFSIVVEDLKAICEELAAKGVSFVRPPEKGYGFDLAEFADPEGNQIRLVQFTTLQPPV